MYYPLGNALAEMLNKYSNLTGLMEAPGLMEEVLRAFLLTAINKK